VRGRRLFAAMRIAGRFLRTVRPRLGLGFTIIDLLLLILVLVMLLVLVVVVYVILWNLGYLQ